MGGVAAWGRSPNFLFLFIGIYLTVAIPEELLFRGILQNLLVRTIHKGPQGSLRPADRLGGVRRRAPAPRAGPQLALCHPGHAGGNLLRECLPHPAAPVRLRADPRAGGYDLAFLVLTLDAFLREKDFTTERTEAHREERLCTPGRRWLLPGQRTRVLLCGSSLCEPLCAQW